MNLGLTSLGLRFKFGPITAPGGWRRWRGSSWGYWRAGGGRDRGVAESLEVWYSKWRAYLLKEKWQWDLQQAKHNMQWNHFWRILYLYDLICIYSRYTFCCYIYILCLLAQTAITCCKHLYIFILAGHDHPLVVQTRNCALKKRPATRQMDKIQCGWLPFHTVYPL